jgi:hypothetical protein
MVSPVGFFMVSGANCAKDTARGEKNALILWTTRYMDAAVQQLRSDGCEVKREDVARLSPLTSKHFHMLG